MRKKSSVKNPIQEGGIYLLPLDNGNYAVGLIIRTIKNKTGILTTFFADEISEKSPQLASEVIARRNILDITDSGVQTLKSGEWPIVGLLEGFKRSDWPVPIFRTTTGIHMRHDQEEYNKVIQMHFDPGDEPVFREVTHGVYALAFTINKMLKERR